MYQGETINKVVVNGEVVIDLTKDTVTRDTLRKGVRAHDRGGSIIVGTFEIENILQEGNITKNGTHTPSYGYEGFSRVNVDVKPKLQNKAISKNGTYTFDSNYDGLSKVVVNVEGSGTGKPTLFAPSIELSEESNALTITDTDNGSFAVSYYLYANDEFVDVLTSKEINLDDYITQQKMFDVKVQAVGENFNSSAYSNSVSWTNIYGTDGLSYSIADDRSHCICTGIGSAKGTEIVIARKYNGIPVTSINGSAFAGNTNITSVVIPDGVGFMSTRTFMDCSNLTSVRLPVGTTWIRFQTFSGCKSLTSIFIPSTVTSIDSGAFNLCPLKRVDFSTHTRVPQINSAAFSNTPADMQIKVPENLFEQWKAATNWSNYGENIVTEWKD